MKILVIEDDPKVARTLVLAFTKQHYEVEVATDGLLGFELATSFEYDLLVIDVMLPKLDGISLCRKLRSAGLQMPILLLTALDAQDDKAGGLDAGADDYVVKPFGLQELFARVRALLRRGPITSNVLLTWEGLSLNPSTFEVRYNDQPVKLFPKEYMLLELLMRHSNRVFDHNTIIQHLWASEDPPDEGTVRAHIKGLRRHLKEVGAPANLIETVHGIGYRLNPVIQQSSTAYQGSSAS